MSNAGVGGIVLAAGRSRRMGEPKALARAGDLTFVERTIGALRGGGCAPVVVVVGGSRQAAALAAGLAEEAGALAVVNDDPASEQIDSLRMGLDALSPRAGAAAVLPVDHPLVGAGTVAVLVARWREGPDRIVRPVRAGRPGHPTIFPRGAWPALMGDLPRGARTVVEDAAHPTEDVPVDDAGVVADIDTPEAYARWLKGG